VDDDRMMAKTLHDILSVKGFESDIAYSGAEALEKVDEEQYGCVLSDIKMPEVNGVELYRAIKERNSDLPVVLMTAYSTDGLVQEGLKEGVIACLNKPLDLKMLLNFFSTLYEERTVVLIDDDPLFRKTLGDILQARGFSVIRITDHYNVSDKLTMDGQVVLLDMKLNHLNGLDVLQEIRKLYPKLPVILVTGYRDEMAAAINTALEINAFTCMYKPLQLEKLLSTLGDIHRQELCRILGRPDLKKEKGV